MSEKQEATVSRGTQGRETPSGWGTGRRPGGRTLKERGNVFAWRRGQGWELRVERG